MIVPESTLVVFRFLGTASSLCGKVSPIAGRLCNTGRASSTTLWRYIRYDPTLPESLASARISGCRGFSA
eukprot:5404982-Amphidinium_carterae.1